MSSPSTLSSLALSFNPIPEQPPLLPKLTSLLESHMHITYLNEGFEKESKKLRE